MAEGCGRSVQKTQSFQQPSAISLFYLSQAAWGKPIEFTLTGGLGAALGVSVFCFVEISFKS
jgi:hypothetical protein